jgi:ribosomal protein S18
MNLLIQLNLKITFKIFANLASTKLFKNNQIKPMNRYQTRLPSSVHRKLAKTVKRCRHMGLLPVNDYIRPTDKLPLTSIYNDFVEDTSQVVDKKTGMIKIVQLPSLEDKLTYSNYSNSNEANNAAEQE